MSGYLSVVVYLGFILAFALVSLGAAWVLSPHRPLIGSKSDTYECGAEPIGEAWVQFPVGFYLVALIFIVFDALAVFLFPWVLVLPHARRPRPRHHGAVHRDSRPGLGLRLPGAHPRMAVKGPDPGDSGSHLEKLQGSPGVGAAPQDASRR